SDVSVGEFAVNAVNHAAKFAGINEEGLATAVAKLPLSPALSPRVERGRFTGFVAREEPEADGDLRRVKELAGERDHTVHEIGREILVQVAMEAVGGFVAEVAFDAANGEVHFGQAPGGGIAFLAEDAEVAFGLATVAVACCVGLHEFDGLDEHATRAAARVEDT